MRCRRYRYRRPFFPPLRCFFSLRHLLLVVDDLFLFLLCCLTEPVSVSQHWDYPPGVPRGYPLLPESAHRLLCSHFLSLFGTFLQEKKRPTAATTESSHDSQSYYNLLAAVEKISGLSIIFIDLRAAVHASIIYIPTPFPFLFFGQKKKIARGKSCDEVDS